MPNSAKSHAAPGLIIAAPSSGSGKTVLTLALLRQFARAGTAVASFKVGPDYIDPAFHAAASGRDCLNLDPWGMRPETVSRLAAEIGRNAALVIGEGVMGLFDGAADGSGSTADLAARFGWPVLLVVDVRGQGASVAALVRGFASHRADIAIAGVLFNRVGGAEHRRALENAMAGLDLPVLGALPRDAALTLPARHLGLVQARENAALDGFLERAADLVTDHVDCAALAALARRPRIAAPPPPTSPCAPPLAPLGQRIAIARDDAFAFCYPALVTGWRGGGAEISLFSPLADEAPEATADAVYLPGGYPELHAGRIAGNATFLAGLRAAAARGATVFGECGGYMVLGRGLVDAAGTRHAMAGLLALETSFEAPRLHLGYRDTVLAADGALGPAGARFRGHEFHYAKVLSEDRAAPLWRCHDARGRDLGAAGMAAGAVMGSFIHLIDRV